MRLSCLLPVLFFAAAGLIHADGSITSGTITSTGGDAPRGTIHVQGPNLSINGLSVDGSLGLVHVNANSQTVTFFPAQTATSDGPPLGLVYNGTAYNTVIVTFNFFGGPIMVPNAATPGAPLGSYEADVANIPFSMTGTVNAYLGSLAGPAALSIPISGSGVYTAHTQGNFDARGPGGVPGGNVTYQFQPPYFSLDTITQGAWNGKYGGDGYWIANGASSLPSYASVSVIGASTYTWAGQTSDPRALQNGAGATVGIASAFTQYASNSFHINVNMTDGNPHRVALYLLDWDTANTRTETVTITDANTNAVLDTEPLSNFHNGEYAVWNLQGNLILTVTPSGNGSPVVSGIFFGPAGAASEPPAGPSASVSYAGLDTTTEGAWTGKYGAHGYMIANGSSSAPTYASASVKGGFTYTWANQTTDPRALQSSPGSATGIASAYTAYSGASFSINVNVTDGNLHPIALYLLDWDTTSRAQTITILDAASNTVLDTKTFSGFHNGQYAVWNIKGNVTISVTPNGGASGVVSGVFFN
jgi:hypothetical protein